MRDWSALVFRYHADAKYYRTGGYAIITFAGEKVEASIVNAGHPGSSINQIIVAIYEHLPIRHYTRSHGTRYCTGEGVGGG